jgi:hypothetical protein
MSAGRSKNLSLAEDGEAACRTTDLDEDYEWAGPARIGEEGGVIFASSVDLLEALLDLRERLDGVTTEAEAVELAGDRASIARHKEREVWRLRPLGHVAERIHEHLERFDEAERARLPAGAPPAVDPPSGPPRAFRAPGCLRASSREVVRLL